MLGRSGEAQEVRRAGRQLAAVRAGAAGLGTPVRRLRGSWTDGTGGRGGFTTMTRRRSRRSSARRPVLGLLPDVLRRRRAAATGQARRAHARGDVGARRRAGRSHADARGALSRRDAAPLDEERAGPHAHRGRAHPRRRQGRVPGARRRRGRSRDGGGSAGDLYLRVHVRPHGRFERRGQDLHAKIPVPARRRPSSAARRRCRRSRASRCG